MSVFAWKLFCKWYISTLKPSRRTVLGDSHRFVIELISETYSEVRRLHNNIPEDTSLLGLSLARGGEELVWSVHSPPGRTINQPASGQCTSAYEETLLQYMSLQPARRKKLTTDLVVLSVLFIHGF